MIITQAERFPFRFYGKSLKTAPAVLWTAGAREKWVEWRYMAFLFLTFRTVLSPVAIFYRFYWIPSVILPN
jgi:hypothetical protein